MGAVFDPGFVFVTTEHSELNAKAAEFKPSWLPTVTAAPAKPNGTAVNGIY